MARIVQAVQFCLRGGQEPLVEVEVGGAVLVGGVLGGGMRRRSHRRTAFHGYSGLDLNVRGDMYEWAWVNSAIRTRAASSAKLVPILQHDGWRHHP